MCGMKFVFSQKTMLVMVIDAIQKVPHAPVKAVTTKTNFLTGLPRNKGVLLLFELDRPMVVHRPHQSVSAMVKPVCCLRAITRAKPRVLLAP